MEIQLYRTRISDYLKTKKVDAHLIPKSATNFYQFIFTSASRLTSSKRFYWSPGTPIGSLRKSLIDFKMELIRGSDRLEAKYLGSFLRRQIFDLKVSKMITRVADLSVKPKNEWNDVKFTVGGQELKGDSQVVDVRILLPGVYYYKGGSFVKE